VRVTIQALAAVLGGCQSLHTNSLDETMALPTEESVTIALRTQQIIAYESGVADTVDPLGGSHYIEWLTDKMEREAMVYINKIDELGGMVSAIEKQYPQREIANAAYTYQKEVDAKEKIIVGVNRFKSAQEEPLDLLQISEEVERQQVESLKKLRKERDNSKCSVALKTLQEKAAGKENLMPFILDCVNCYATLGEIVETMKKVFGEYREPSEF
jgi:methylmalonyl-CoA mutase N-terminal domain/subunit